MLDFALTVSLRFKYPAPLRITDTTIWDGHTARFYTDEQAHIVLQYLGDIWPGDFFRT